MTYGPGYPVYPGSLPGPVARIAGTGVRFGAWLLDLVLLGLIGLLPALLAVLTGGVAFNAAAMDQVSQNPSAPPTVPYLVVNTGPLVAAAALWVALVVAYGAVSWTLARATPAQKALSLEVVDAATGDRLGIVRAVLRSVLVNGIPAAATAVITVAMCQVLTVVIPADFQQSSDSSVYLDQAGLRGIWGGLLDASVLVVWCWPLVLLLTAASAKGKRGLHDRLSGSLVVVRTVGRWPGHPYAAPAGRHVAPTQWPSSAPFLGAPPSQLIEPGAEPDSVAADQPPDPDDALSPDPPGAQVPPPWPGLLPEDPARPTWPFGAPTPGEGAAEAAARDRERAAPGRQGPLGAKLPEGLRIARYNRRLRAYAIDCVILLVIYLFTSALVAGDVQNGIPVSERQAMIAGLAGGAIQLAYFVLSWSILRGTIGQKILGLKLVNQSAGRLGVLDALARWAVLQGPFALSTAAPTGWRRSCCSRPSSGAPSSPMRRATTRTARVTTTDSLAASSWSNPEAPPGPAYDGSSSSPSSPTSNASRMNCDGAAGS